MWKTVALHNWSVQKLHVHLRKPKDGPRYHGIMIIKNAAYCICVRWFLCCSSYLQRVSNNYLSILMVTSIITEQNGKCSCYLSRLLHLSPAAAVDLVLQGNSFHMPGRFCSTNAETNINFFSWSNYLMRASCSLSFHSKKMVTIGINFRFKI